MRVTHSALALCAIGASAAVLPAATEVEARQESSAIWYMVGFQPECGTFGCPTDYAVFGAPDAVPGAPAFSLRCNTYGPCTNTLPGSTVNALVPINKGPLTVTQTFTSGGKTTTATGTVNWDGLSLASFTIPVTYTVS